MGDKEEENKRGATWKDVSRGKPMTAPFDARFPNQNQTRNCWQVRFDAVER